MHKVHVEELQPGMLLGKDIYNEQDRVLLARGVALTRRYIEVLQRLGFYAIYIMDGIADDVIPTDILSDRVHITVSKHVRQLFTIGQNSPLALSDDKLRPSMTNLMNAAQPVIGQLYRDVERIIDQAASAQVLSGVTSLKNHDSYTFDHSVEVAVAGVLLGIRMRLQPLELHQLALGCLCHDIGKLAVPTDILQKLGPLTEEEQEVVRQHPTTGYEIARQIMGSSDILARHIVWQHHERQDGLGYPRGLRGTNEIVRSSEGRFGRGLILPVAEIAVIAEVYAGLASDQPHRPAMPLGRIATTLREMAGTHLNREIVNRFLSILPGFSLGSEVVVIAGQFQHHRGVVTEIHPDDLQRPTIRILFDPSGQSIPPFELDCRLEKDIGLAATS